MLRYSSTYSIFFQNLILNFFLLFWRLFRIWDKKWVVLKVPLAKATKYKDGNKKKYDVAMVRK